MFADTLLLAVYQPVTFFVIVTHFKSNSKKKYLFKKSNDIKWMSGIKKEQFTPFYI